MLFLRQLKRPAAFDARSSGCDSNQLELPFIEAGRTKLNSVIDQKGISADQGGCALMRSLVLAEPIAPVGISNIRPTNHWL